MRSIIFCAVASFAIGMAVTNVTANTEIVEEEEPEFGILTVAEGVETTFYTCSGCHSEKIIAQQGLSYDRWDELLTWMVEKQGMGEPDAEDRKELLAYLSTNYGAAAGSSSGPVSNPNISAADSADAEFGVLVVADGVETTYYTCAACHSERIIAQQGMTRDNWDELLDWMIEDQGMGEPDDEDRKEILDYLAAYYNEDRVNYPSTN